MARTSVIVISVGLIALCALAGAAWWPRNPLPPEAVRIEGGSLVAAPLQPGAAPRTLVRGFAVVANPAASFDGGTILFAGKQSAADSKAIYEIERSGGDPRKLVAEAGADCTEPHYLPGGKVVYVRTQGSSDALYAWDSDTGKSERLTWNVEPISQTSVLADGRILLSLHGRWCTVNPDGTGIGEYNGTESQLAVLRAAAAKVVAGPRPAPTGHVSVIDRKKSVGKLFCTNAYISDVNGLDTLPGGAIRKVRIWIADPNPRVLADVDAAPDGSFSLETPIEAPLRIETLGVGGRPLGTCGWIWLRPNESRGCIGCHESSDLTPENRVPDAIRKPPVKIRP